MGERESLFSAPPWCQHPKHCAKFKLCLCPKVSTARAPKLWPKGSYPNDYAKRPAPTPHWPHQDNYTGGKA